MKTFLPLIAVAGLVVACSTPDNDYNNPQNPHAQRSHMHDGHAHHDHTAHGHTHAQHHAVSPVPSATVYPDGTTVYRPDGVYPTAPALVERGYQHKKTDDALSDRSLGATRGSHGQPMTAKDSDHDGNYDYVPHYAPRPHGYYYSN